MSLWQFRQTATALGLGNPGDLPACGLWQSVQSPCAPGCCTFAFSICSAFSEWQVTHSALALAWVRTTLPSLAGWWQLSHDFDSNGLCRKACISFGDLDWCGSWQVRQSAFSKGWFRCALTRLASFVS